MHMLTFITVYVTRLAEVQQEQEHWRQEAQERAVERVFVIACTIF